MNVAEQVLITKFHGSRSRIGDERQHRCDICPSRPCGDGELLLFAQNRENSAQDVSHARPGQGRRVRYIERFYNPRRRHSTIGYLSPVEFKKQALLDRMSAVGLGGSPRAGCLLCGHGPKGNGEMCPSVRSFAALAGSAAIETLP